MTECPLCKQQHEVCDGVLQRLQQLEASVERLEDRAISPLERAHRDFVAGVRRAGR